MDLRDPRYLDCYHLNVETKELHPVLPQVNHRPRILAESNQPKVALNYKPDGKKLLEVFENGTWHKSMFIRPYPDDWYV